MSSRDYPLELACAENIALLSLYTDVPNDPDVNRPIIPANGGTPSRVLSFERELRLSDSIALIAGVSDGGEHVVASCIEELPNQAGLRILLAINKEKPTSEDEVLHRIQYGLEKIFSLLAQSQDEEPILQERVLDGIVEMCRERLLCYLGLQRGKMKKMKKKSKKPLLARLQQVTNAIQSHHPEPTASIRLIIENANNLLSLLQNHETLSQSSEQLNFKRITESANTLVEKVELPAILDNIEPEKLEPGMKRGVMHRLKKLSAYHKSAQLLSQSAKMLRAFKNVTVVPISLAPKWFSRTPQHLDGPNLQGCLSRCDAAGKSIKPEDFSKKVKIALKKSKFHAELQLIADLELHPRPIKPRVISSSKIACYLCNLFIHLHGHYYIKRTHGKLYAGWRIPQIPAFEATQARLAAKLAVQIREADGDAGRKRRPDPNESVAPTVSPFMSVTSLARRLGETPTRSKLSLIVGEKDVLRGNHISGIIDGVTSGRTTPRPRKHSQHLDDEAPPEQEWPLDINSAPTNRSLVKEPSSRASSVKEIIINDPSIKSSSIESPSIKPSSTRGPPRSKAPSRASSIKEQSATAPSIKSPSIPESSPKASTIIHNPSTDDLPLGDPTPPPAPTHPHIQSQATYLTLNSQPSSLELNDPEHSDPQVPQHPETHKHELDALSTKALSSGSFQPQIQPKPPTPHKAIQLTRGRPLTHRLDIPSATSYAYTAGLLTINPSFIYATPSQTPGNISSSSSSWPSFPESSSSSSRGERPVEMRLRWLTIGEGEEVLAGRRKATLEGGGDVISVEEIPFIDFDTGRKERVYLRHGRDIVEICVVREYTSLGGSNDAVVSGVLHGDHGWSS